LPSARLLNPACSGAPQRSHPAGVFLHRTREVLTRAGIVAVEGAQPYDRAYQFSNGRKFKDRRNPYV